MKNTSYLESFNKVWKLLSKQQRTAFIRIMILLFFSMIMEFISLAALLPIIDFENRYLQIVKSPVLSFLHLSRFTKKEVFYILIGLVLLVYIFKFIYLTFASWYQSTFLSTIQRDLSFKLFVNYMRMNYETYAQKNSAQLASNVIRETSILVGGSLTPFLTVLTEFFILLSIVIVLVLANPGSAIVLVIFFGLITYITISLTKNRITKWGKSRVESDKIRSKYLQLALHGFKEIKVYQVEDFFLDNYEGPNKSSARTLRNQSFVQQMPRLFLESITIMGIVVYILILSISGKALTEIVPIVAITAAASFRMIPSANRLLLSIQALKFGSSVIDLVDQEFEESSKQVAPVYPEIELSFNNLIRFENVDYRYPNTTKATLQNISFDIEKNSIVGVIGPSGAGKSTLINLLLGLINPSNGHIYIDQTDLKFILNGWRRNVGFVPQDIFLLDGSIKHNIAFGVADKDIDLEKLQTAIDSAELSTFISSLPLGVETNVGERGALVSGGQKQRIAIARALYNNPDLLLFDEATSALDKETDINITSSIKKLSLQKTIIIITHRENNLSICDKIFRIDGGRIREVNKEVQK